MDFFQKGGGGTGGNQKVLENFLCTKNFGILGRKVAGVDQIQKFWSTFYPDFTLILVKYDTKSVPKFPKKNQPTKKCPKSSKSLGGEGSDHFGRSP